ncbi:MAG: sigma-70 family RNA polymerase sigma factor [Bacteroidota bacterium]
MSNNQHQDLTLNDEQLFELCRQNDVKAQEALYRKHANAMFRLCHRYMKDDHLSEEAMIQGFYKVLTKVDTFQWRGPASFVAWIKRIMVNESLMLLRKQKQHTTSNEDEMMMIANQDYAENGLLAEQVHQMVAMLPAGYRTVFNLYIIEGYSHKEIAQKLGVQESTSKSQLSKARNLLKKWVTKLDML